MLTTHVYDITKSFGEMTAQKISQWVKNEKEQRNERVTTEKKSTVNSGQQYIQYIFLN